MTLPARIFDLHTHLFNARYIPLASIIANAMGKDESNLANHVARLLEELTESSYPEPEPPESHDEESLDEYRLERIWNVTRHELLGTTGSLDAMDKGLNNLMSRPLSAPAFHLLHSSGLMKAIKSLSEVDYVAEGWDRHAGDRACVRDPLWESGCVLDVRGFSRLGQGCGQEGVTGRHHVDGPRGLGGSGELSRILPDHAEIGKTDGGEDFYGVTATVCRHYRFRTT